MQGTTFLSFFSVSFGISFEHAVQLPFTVFLYSPFPDNYAFLSLSPSQIKTFSQLTQCPFTGTLLLFSVSFGISFEHAVQLPFTVFLYSPFPDNYAFLSLSPSQIKNIQSADTVPVHGHSPLVWKDVLFAWGDFMTKLFECCQPYENICGPLWYNQENSHALLFEPSLYQKGIISPIDLLTKDGNILTLEEIHTLFNSPINFLTYHRIYSTLKN